MERVDAAAALQWTGLSLEEVFAGVPPREFAECVRILHAMYETPGTPEMTWDDLAKRTAAPSDGPVDSILRGAVAPGIPLGIVQQPANSARLRWRELLARYAVVLDETQVDLSGSLRTGVGASFPAAIQPPPEGSLDASSLTALVPILAKWTAPGACYFYFCMLATEALEPLVMKGELAEVIGLSHSGAVAGTPQNWWPTDRSWLVYTDWDLNTTMIGGPAGLISAVRAEPALECASCP